MSRNWSPSPSQQSRPSVDPRQAGRGWRVPFTENAVGFAEGGAIPTEEDDMSMGPANGLMSMLAKATGSVKEVLAYGRRKHGLLPGEQPGGDDEGAIPGVQANAGYQNGRMPMVPGTQSESGVPPVRPAPGPLPPTSNPFGKRAEAEPEETTGAIDTDEEEMA